MDAKIVAIPTNRIKDWSSFHDVFREMFGFPDFYGSNMNAWVDCMSSLDVPDDGLTQFSVQVGGVVILCIGNAPDFQSRCPEQYDALIEGASFVNYRRSEIGSAPVVALMLSGQFINRDQ